MAEPDTLDERDYDPYQAPEVTEDYLKQLGLDLNFWRTKTLETLEDNYVLRKRFKRNDPYIKSWDWPFNEQSYRKEVIKKEITQFVELIRSQKKNEWKTTPEKDYLKEKINYQNKLIKALYDNHPEKDFIRAMLGDLMPKEILDEEDFNAAIEI
jgi:hypothetical protein